MNATYSFYREYYITCFKIIKTKSIMAIKKQFVKSKPLCKVTFSILAKEAQSASVIGDFNNWNTDEGTLVKLKNGTFKGVFNLPKDNTFEFKYLIDGTYINDPEADGLKWNPYAGSENSIVRTLQLN